LGLPPFWAKKSVTDKKSVLPIPVAALDMSKPSMLATLITHELTGEHFPHSNKNTLDSIKDG